MFNRHNTIPMITIESFYDIRGNFYQLLILLPLGTKVDKGRKNTPGMPTYSKRLFKIF